MFTRRSFFATGALAAVGAGCRSFSPVSDGAVKRDRHPEPFRLGFAGYTFYKFKIEQALEMMRKIDVHYLCIKDFHLPMKASDIEIKEFHAKCAAAGVVGHGVGPITVATPEEADAMFEYARRVGVRTIVCVPMDKERDGKKGRFASRRMCEFLSRKLDLSENSEFRLAIHNHGPESPELFPTGKSVFEMVKDLNPRLGLCLDIGHDFRWGYDPVDSIRTCASRIFDVHVKDEPEQSCNAWCVPAGRGRMNWPAIVKALRAANYAGIVNVEYERDMDDPLAGIAETIGYLRGVMASI